MGIIDYLTHEIYFGKTIENASVDGYYVNSWIAKVDFSSSYSRLCQFIQIDKKRSKKGIFVGDIESEEELKYKMQKIIAKLEDWEKEKAKRKKVA